MTRYTYACGVWVVCLEHGGGALGIFKYPVCTYSQSWTSVPFTLFFLPQKALRAAYAARGAKRTRSHLFCTRSTTQYLTASNKAASSISPAAPLKQSKYAIFMATRKCRWAQRGPLTTASTSSAVVLWCCARVLLVWSVCQIKGFHQERRLLY